MAFASSRRLWLVLGGLCVCACLSPTLPLPPPSRPDVDGPDPEGFVVLTGHVPPHTEAIAYNPRTRQIVGELTMSDGAYRLKLEAEVGDELSFRYRDGTDDSPSIIVVVRAPDTGERSAPSR
jgi:hypothetical protein